MITVKNLCKEYKTIKREESRKGYIKHFFKRKYETTQVVNNLNFHIPKGEIVGFIGPNGAGKTTTIRMLTGILAPTSGTVRVDCKDPYKKRIENLRQIGCVFGHKTQLWQGMPVIDSFEMVKHMYKISEEQYKENMQFFCKNLELDSILNTPVHRLSLGERMRADFACAMLHNPKIVYLDEPTIGLDVIAKEKVLNFIIEMNKKYNTTVLFTTHNLMDLERLCSRVLIIDKGQIIYNGDIKRLKSVYDSEHIIQLKTDMYKLPDFQDLPVKKYKIENDNLWITYDSRNINSSVILGHLVKQCSVKEVKIQEPKLNEIIYRIYENI